MEPLPIRAVSPPYFKSSRYPGPHGRKPMHGLIYLIGLVVVVLVLLSFLGLR